MTPLLPCKARRKAVWGSKRVLLLVLLVLVGVTSTASAATRHTRVVPKKASSIRGSQVRNYKLDDELTTRVKGGNPLQTTSVIVTLAPGVQLPSEFKKFARGGKLDIINGQALDLPNGVLKKLAAHPSVFRLHFDRPTATHNYRSAVTVGMRAVQQALGYTGAGVGVAVIDSGITTWHDDLTNKTSTTVYPYGNQRVTTFVDFVNGQTLPYDDNGHGSHVAGIILGNGFDSYGEKAGMAPGASLVALKVLDANGQGTVSRIIAALNWVVANAATYNIKVVNMSIGAGIHESYWTDPLTLAAKAVTDKGIVVVAAAGNLGKNAAGLKQLRRHHGAGQRAVGPDGRRLEHDGHAHPLRRHDGGLQLAWADVHRLPREAGRGRAGHRNGFVGRAGQHVLRDQGAVPRERQAQSRREAVSEPERHEHGGASCGRHGRGDVPGEPEPDAEPGEGDPAVHGAAVWGTACGDTTCDNVVWGTAAGDNVVWGTSADADVTWGSASEDAALYPDDEALLPLPSVDLEFGDVVPLVDVPAAGAGSLTTPSESFVAPPADATTAPPPGTVSATSTDTSTTSTSSTSTQVSVGGF